MGNGWRLFLASVLLVCVIPALGNEKAEESEDKATKEENAGWEIVGEETGIDPQYVKGDTGPAETKDLFSGFSDVQVHDGYVKGVIAELPRTNFDCSSTPYIPGLYADMEVQCQVYHVCFDNRKETFRCGEGTLFNQKILACDHWYNVRCEDAPRYYQRNENIGKTPTISHFQEKAGPKRPVHLEPPIYPVPHQEPHHDAGGQGIKSTHDEPKYPARPPPIRQPPFPVPHQPSHPDVNIKGYEEPRPPVKRPPPPARQPPPVRQPPPPPRQPPQPPKQPSIRPPVFVPPEEIYHPEADIKGYEPPAPPPRPRPQVKPPTRPVPKPSFPPPQQVIHPNYNEKGGSDFHQPTIPRPRPQPKVQPPVFPPHEQSVDLKGYDPPRVQLPARPPPSIHIESGHPNYEVKGIQQPPSRPHQTIEETHYEPPIHRPPPPQRRPHPQPRPQFPPPDESVHPNYEVKGYQPPRPHPQINPPTGFETVHPHEEVKGYEPPPPPPPPRRPPPQVKQPSFPPPSQVIHPNYESKGYQPPRHQPSRSQVQVKPKPFPQEIHHPEADAKGYQPPPPPPPPRRPVQKVKPPVFPPPEQTIHQTDIKGGDIYEPPRPPPRPRPVVQPPYQPPSISTVIHSGQVKGYQPPQPKPEKTINPPVVHPNQNVKGGYEDTGSLAIGIQPLPPGKHSFPPQQLIHPNANVKGQVNYQGRQHQPSFSGVRVQPPKSDFNHFEEGALPFEHHNQPRHPPSPPAKIPYVPKEPQDISFPPPRVPSGVRVNIQKPRDYPRHQQRTNQKETRFTAPSSRGNQVKYVFPPYQEPDPSHPNANIKGGPGYRRPEPYSQPEPSQRFQRSQRLYPAQSNLQSSYGRGPGYYPKPEFGRSNLEVPVAQVNYPFITHRTGYSALESSPSVSIIDPFSEPESDHQQEMMVDSEE